MAEELNLTENDINSHCRALRIKPIKKKQRNLNFIRDYYLTGKMPLEKVCTILKISKDFMIGTYGPLLNVGMKSFETKIKKERERVIESEKRNSGPAAIFSAFKIASASHYYYDDDEPDITQLFRDALDDKE